MNIVETAYSSDVDLRLMTDLSDIKLVPRYQNHAFRCNRELYLQNYHRIRYMERDECPIIELLIYYIISNIGGCFVNLNINISGNIILKEETPMIIIRDHLYLLNIINIMTQGFGEYYNFSCLKCWFEKVPNNDELHLPFIYRCKSNRKWQMMNIIYEVNSLFNI